MSALHADEVAGDYVDYVEHSTEAQPAENPAKGPSGTVSEIRERWEKATPGPWHWAGNTATNQLWLATWVAGLGRTTVMDFVRWGMRYAQPRFNVDGVMEKASENVVWEVAPTATSPDDARLYRHDLTGVRHPDAEAIAAAPADVATLLAEVDRLTGLLEQAARAGRRANNDPGAYVKRIFVDEDGDVERLDRWQERALQTAIAELVRGGGTDG